MPGFYPHSSAYKYLQLHPRPKGQRKFWVSLLATIRDSSPSAGIFFAHPVLSRTAIREVSQNVQNNALTNVCSVSCADLKSLGDVDIVKE